MTKEKHFCLIGSPVAGSLSPRLMEAAYGGRYGYGLVEEASFDEAWARATVCHGFNVTAPFKFLAFERAGEHDPVSAAAGACNLLLPVSGGWKSYNTDVDGVLGALREAGVGPAKGQKALIVGTGGAAAAARVAVAQLGRECLVMGRNTVFAPSELETVDLVIYTRPGSAPVPEGLPLSQAVVLEAEYRMPRLTDAPCGRYVSGKRWMLHQALTGFGLLTGEEPDAARMEEVLRTLNP